MNNLKRTPLRDFHVAHGARLVEFAGWEMPVQYRSILEEHRAVRGAAGLFDVSHMGEAEVTGRNAADFLNHLVTNDVGRLYPGRALYSPMCRPDGGVVDDLIVYQRGPDSFLLCLNAGNTETDVEWMRRQAEGWDVVIDDRSDDYALLALQGPRAAQIMQTLTGTRLDEIKYYHFAEGRVAGVSCLLSRTGYTGEDGFELYHAAGEARPLATALLEAGVHDGLELVGLGARDSLRLEAGYPLYGHEISAEISPIAAGLGWTVKLGKDVDFTGREALASEKAAGPMRKIVYFRTGDRRIVRAGTPVFGPTGAVAGQVVSGTLSPMLNEAIGSALVDGAAAGQPLSSDIRGARIDLRPVMPPFVPLPKH